MRIAHVTDCYLPRLGGIERQVQGLATAQLAAGHQVTVITSVPANASLPAPAEPGELTVLRPAESSGRPGSIRYLSSLRGRQAVRRGGYDLVHVHASTFSPLAYLAAGAASRSGMATVATLHSLWSYATPIFRGADAALDWRAWPITWTAVSTAAADSLSQVLRPGVEISVLANGVSPERWRLPPRPRDPERVVIVSVMRLAARKRPMQLLKVLRAVRAQVPAGISVQAQIIGAGPQRDAMLAYLRRHRMTGWVELTGQLDQPAIRDRFADADLYVSPATLESFGIAALEARCAGLPVLAFAGTGVSDFIEHGHNGLLVRSDDQLATALARLACSPAERARLSGPTPPGAGGGSESGYTWDQVLQTCEQVYRRACEQASRPMPPALVPGSLPALPSP
ncbi:MAG TPA: glycosyltransferase family 4 protein [Jatrophihabitans sp.]|jgi:glycosyltransferase involved in cell wall biosynthesis|uniref:glycosyltransferase family 4 protein n=1 Tax=Jatrophihabitans sp. TaxID=1932789 RepID=UPI002F0EC0D9